MIALFDFAASARYVGAIVEYKRYDELGILDGFLHGKEFFA